MKNVIFLLLFFAANSSVAAIKYVAGGSTPRDNLLDAWRLYAASEDRPNTNGTCEPYPTMPDAWTCKFTAFNGGKATVLVEKKGKCNLGDDAGTYEYPSFYGYPDASGNKPIYVQKISPDDNKFMDIFCVNGCQAAVARESDIGKLMQKAQPSPGIFLYVYNVKLTESAKTCTVSKLPNTDVPPYVPPAPSVEEKKETDGSTTTTTTTTSDPVAGTTTVSTSNSGNSVSSTTTTDKKIILLLQF